MQSAILVLAAAAGVVNAWAGNYSMTVGSAAASYTTTTVVDTTTVSCGASGTTITGSAKTYTLTAHETSTITDCGCTKTTVIPAIPYTTTTTDIFTSTEVYCPAPTTLSLGPTPIVVTAVREFAQRRIFGNFLTHFSRRLQPSPSRKAALVRRPRLSSTLLVFQSPPPA